MCFFFFVFSFLLARPVGRAWFRLRMVLCMLALFRISLVCVDSIISRLQYFLILIGICRCEFVFVVVWCGLVRFLII